MQIFSPKICKKVFYLYTFVGMNYKIATAQECAADFVENVWPQLFKGSRGSRNNEYMKVRAFVKDVRGGTAKDGRIIDYLKQYGGSRYKISVDLKIMRK